MVDGDANRVTPDHYDEVDAQLLRDYPELRDLIEKKVADITADIERELYT